MGQYQAQERVTVREWQEWANNPITLAFKEKVLRIEREQIKEDWANGNLPNSEKSLGMAEAISELITTLEEMENGLWKY
jgi:hypothetical protein